MTEKTKEQLIYEMAIGEHESTGGYHFNASKIAKYLKVSEAYVSKVLHRLCCKGLIKCISGKDLVKIYSSTKKSPKTIQTKLTGVSGGVLTNFTGVSQGRVFTTSKSQWSCPVDTIGNSIEWETRKLQNGVMKYFKEYLFGPPIDTILYFQVVGKTHFKLTVTFPPMSYDSKDEFLQAKDQVGYLAKSAIHFMAKKYNMGIDITKTYLSYADFEAPLREPDVKRLIESAQVIIKYHSGLQYMGELKLDGSGGIDKIESRDHPEWIADYVEIPSFRKQLKEVKEIIPQLKEGQEKIMKQQQELMNMFTATDQQNKMREKDNQHIYG